MSCSYSDPASGWAGRALAHPEFGVSVNPIPTRRGTEYAYHITACPPGFENLTASLLNTLKWNINIRYRAVSGSENVVGIKLPPTHLVPTVLR